MGKCTTLVLAFVAAFVQSARGAVVDDEFNAGATDFASHFNVYNAVTPSAGFSWAAGSGVNDGAGGTPGGGVASSGNPVDASAVYQGLIVPLSDGQVHSISEYVKAPTGLSVLDKYLQIGFLAPGSASFNANTSSTTPTGFSFISARILGNNTVEFQYNNASQNATSINNTVPTGTITAGDWLKLSFDATQSAPGNFGGTFSLTDYGPTGVGAGTVVLAPVPYTVTGVSNMGDGSNISAGFRTAIVATGVGDMQFDKFAVVPEPTGLVIVGVFGAAMFGRRRVCRKSAPAGRPLRWYS